MMASEPFAVGRLDTRSYGTRRLGRSSGDALDREVVDEEARRACVEVVGSEPLGREERSD
jgi:hypothetical protein